MKNPNMGYLALDVDMYPKLIEKYPELTKEISIYEKEKGGVCRWTENRSDSGKNEFDTYNMEKMDRKSKEILENIIDPKYTDIEKTVAIYKHINEKVTFEMKLMNLEKEIIKDDKKLEMLLNDDRSRIQILTQRLNRRQSSYNAIISNRAVCEGIANMMHYMLTSVGVESQVIDCIDKNVKNTKTPYKEKINHSAIKVKTGEDWYYYDPTWDLGRKKLKNFFKTKKEFSKNHTLTFREEEVKEPEIKEYTNKELNKKNFQNDYKRFLETQSEISKLEKGIEENKTKLENSKKITLNILTKGEYSKILREYKNEEQAEMLLKLEKRFSKGNNKNLYIKTKYNLEKKYKELINAKTMELEKKRVLNNILEGKLDFKDKNNLIIETINSLQKDIANINNQIEKRELQIKSLEKVNIQVKIYDEISKGEFSKVTKQFEANEKEIDKLNEQLKNVNTFNFSLKNKIKAEIEKLEKENSNIAIKYEEIKKSITNEKFNSLKEEYLHKIENGIKTYRKEINNLKDKRQHINYALRKSKDLLFKTSKSNIPSIKNFIENHNRYKANLGEVLRTNINIRWSEDELEKQMRKEMDFSI